MNQIKGLLTRLQCRTSTKNNFTEKQEQKNKE